MIMTINDIFTQAIKGAMDAAAIAESKDKGAIYVGVARAIADSGLLKKDSVEVDAAVSEDQTTKAKPAAKSHKPAKKEEANGSEDKKEVSAADKAKAVASAAKAALERKPAPKKETPKEEVMVEEETEEAAATTTEAAKEETKTEAPAAADEPVETAEWNDASLAKYADEIAYMQEVAGQYGPDAVNTCLGNMTEGTLKDFTTDVNPLNIKMFVEYMKAQLAEADGSEAASN